jgi:Leucine-rich repeat (LRR) protein/CRP-like cAMP-binding protein
LIYVTKGVYRRAIQMQLDLMVQREVDACCRLPFLRHTGLKELFDLAKHLQVVTFSKGDVLLSQGKEALKSPVYFLLEGEVELCVDLPLTHDPQEISNALALLLGNTSSSHLKLKAQAILSGSASRGVQRVVLGKRSGGVILGDEALREDRVMMTVVAAGNAKALSVPSSRFSSSLDPLTQRLFQKPRTQRSTATFVSSMTASGASEARSLLERCRSEILSLTYEGIRGRPPVTLDHSPVKVLKTWINAGDSHISPIKVKASTDFDMTPEASIHPPTTGLTVSRFSQVTQSNSMASFVSSVKELEDQRMVDAIALMNRSKTIDPALDALGLSRRLDLTSIVDRGSSHGRYTELYEAGCLAILRVEEKPGQGLRPALSFALCMDEVIAAWQEIAHSGDLQIVRWSCHEFYLIGRPLFISNLGANDPNNTYIIRTMADSILSMVAVFEKIVGRSEVNLFRTVSAITLGPLFVAFDCGRFVVGLSGQAFDAASALCHQALKEKSSALSSTILISDGVMMSISRTHDCVLTGSTYQLLGPTVLPHGTSFKDLFKAQGGKPSRSYHYCNGGSLHCPIDDGLGGSSLESLSMPFSNMTPRSALIPEAISRPDPLTHKPFDASKVKSLWGKGGSPRPSTLEPRLSLTKSSSLFQKASSTTAMSARQQLRKEIEDIRKSQGQDKIIVAEVSELAPSPPASKTPQWKDCGASRALSEFIIELDDSLNSLSLSTSGLKIFPDLSRLRYLQSLAASFNQFGLHLNTIPVPRASPLSSLPSSLRTLSLSHNGISQLPDEFGSCLPLLVDLNLSNNCLSSIPFSLSMLTCLQALSLQHNRLKSMDEACINALCGLTALYLGYNELSSIGESANSLSGLTSLETLDVSMNALEFLPPTLSHLPSLKCLLASHNLLETLPDGFLSTQAHLTHLDLQGNCLCHCPQLTGLDEFLLDALNNKYSDDPDGLEDIDEDSPPPILADSFSTTFAGSFSSVMMSGPSAYGRAPSLFRSKSMARAPSMKRIGSRRGGPSTLAYTPTPEPHLDVDVQCLTPCQLASSAAQAPSVVKLPHLLVLDLSSNGLLALPPWLPPSLQSLSASNNRLESVHAWLAERLTGLHCLDLQSNRITHLSRSLSQLSVISCVCLADNPCSDVDAATAGGAEMAGWLEEHVIKLKYNKKVQSELQLNREA